MYYFTSDLHFGHENILMWRKGFKSVDEMDKILIDNWNSRVKQNDNVIITGDLFYKSKTSVEKYLGQLKGKKILIKGNHDESWLKNMKQEQLDKFFLGIYDLYGIKINKSKIGFCHYPMISWESSRISSILICGHIHGRKDDFESEMFKKVLMSFNAGVDINNMMPVTLTELIENNKNFYDREYTKEQTEFLRTISKNIEGN